MEERSADLLRGSRQRHVLPRISVHARRTTVASDLRGSRHSRRNRKDWELALWFTGSNGWLRGARPVDLLIEAPATATDAAVAKWKTVSLIYTTGHGPAAAESSMAGEPPIYRGITASRVPSSSTGVGIGRFHPITTRGTMPIPTIYGSSSIDGALSETVFHDGPVSGLPKRFSQSEVIRCSLHEVTERDLTFRAERSPRVEARAKRSQLIDTGADQYVATRRWAEAMFEREPTADGLIWMSRQHDASEAVALFGGRVARGDSAGHRGATWPLSTEYWMARGRARGGSGRNHDRESMTGLTKSQTHISPYWPRVFPSVTNKEAVCSVSSSRWRAPPFSLPLLLQQTTTRQTGTGERRTARTEEDLAEETMPDPEARALESSDDPGFAETEKGCAGARVLDYLRRHGIDGVIDAETLLELTRDDYERRKYERSQQHRSQLHRRHGVDEPRPHERRGTHAPRPQRIRRRQAPRSSARRAEARGRRPTAA